ncbi:hypothetical protein SAMN04488522_1021415 [Pedobacter caeni]|uniref:Uncharacterized protein n=2 Tax=Pedobacter caeni TaxID=288992 RepID=A0A1M5BYL1_9SPHI|nr:hypothetical protein SAMN04488522_1021415 [Pedobacter caeni]
MASKEHKLQVGSFIFSKGETLDVGGGNYFRTHHYNAIHRVIRIDGDLVKVVPLVLWSFEDKPIATEDDFETYTKAYELLKKNITTMTITAVDADDLYREEGTDSASHTQGLLKKYPQLRKSYYWYAALSPSKANIPVPRDRENLQLYLMGVYSAKGIIKNRKLARYNDILPDDNIPEYFENSGDDIDLIINGK